METAATFISANATILPEVAREVESVIHRNLTYIVFDPYILVALFLALACCAGGVMATVYVIRKVRKQRRTREFVIKTHPGRPVYKPIQPQRMV